MILPFEPYNPLWKKQFRVIEQELKSVFGDFPVQIDHIGSTSVDGLSAKPIIDIQLGVETDEDLNKIPELLKLSNVVYYEKYNHDMPTRRFFVLFKQTTDEMDIAPIVKLDEEIPAQLHNHNLRLAHIHAFVKGSEDWLRHIAFRDYLRTNESIKNEYQTLKEKLVKNEWKDGNEYNDAKDAFLKKHEKIALEWYKNSRTK
ncbi:GrpB family protein [Soonwooa sp.]|uniref:GrpB family protein n=1 Tax=Soonwooa sp. TaxID=1938592 RepID=UPI0026176C2E|nr:GrpB family protein [Soonwooa sp.]